MIQVESNERQPNEYVNNKTLQPSPIPGRNLQTRPRPERSFALTKRNPGYVTLDRNTENGVYF